MERNPKFKKGQLVSVSSGDYYFAGKILNIEPDGHTFAYFLFNPEIKKNEWFLEDELSNDKLIRPLYFLDFDLYMKKLNESMDDYNRLILSAPVPKDLTN